MTSPTTNGADRSNHRVGWAVTSAIPGRIRLQATDSSGVTSALHLFATRIAAHTAVTGASVIPEARSIVVRYEPSTHRLPDMVKDVLSAAQDGAVVSAKALDRSDTSDRSDLTPPSTTEMVLVSSDAADTPWSCDDSFTIGCAIGRAVARAPGTTPHIRARDIPFHPPPMAPIVIPTLAVAVAAIEFVPAVVSLAFLAWASVPIARRTADSIKKRQFTPDSMDLANVVLLVFEGSVLQAGAITWLVQLSDLIRRETMRKMRHRLHGSAAIAEREGGELRKRKTMDTIEQALLGNSQHQHVWTKAKNSFFSPLAVLALTAFAVTRDPGYLIGLMRPRADFNSALCFGVPAPMLAAMTRSAAHGPLLRNSQAVERLAQIDAIVFATVGSITDEHMLGRRVRPLMQRGIHRFILPTEKEAHIVRRTAARAGIVGVVAEPMPGDRHSVIRMLVRHGHHVALIDDGLHAQHDIDHADVHIVIDTGQELDARAHVILTHADLHGLVQAIDASREAVHKIRHNTALAASAAGVNLVLSLVPPIAATAVNTAATAITAMNSLRSAKKEGPPERPPHLPHRRFVHREPAIEHGA